jgi:predicted Zn-dependent protease
LLVSSCQTIPATGRASFNVVSAEDEQKMGAEGQAEVLREFGGAYDDPAIQAYVSAIGQRLVAQTETPQAPFRFTVLDSPIINAMSLPGGYIYVTRGILALVDNEAQLASVVGHEIGHVVGHHIALQKSQSIALRVLSRVLVAVTGMKEVGTLSGLGSSVYLFSYSREQESEADTLGLRYMTRAGLDPASMVAMLTKLRADQRLQARLAGRSPDTADEFSLWADHPLTIERINDTATAVAATATAGQGVTGRDTLLERIDGLIYGDTAERGVVHGRVYSHAGMGVRVEVPPGFRIVTNAQGMMALHPDGSLIRLDRGPPANGDLASYIQVEWAVASKLARIERLMINGRPGATATTRLTIEKTTLDVRLVAVGDRRGVTRLMALTPPEITTEHDEDVRTTIASLRPLTEAERPQAQPPRIALITVKPGDSVTTLAAAARFDTLKAERFRLLNGLPEGEERLTPGQRLKTVR